MKWTTGRDDLERMIDRGEIQRVAPSQGLRGTTRGGHIAVYEAVKAQLDPPLGARLRPFNRMRRRRHEGEYPSAEAPTITTDDVREDLARAEQIVDAAEQVLDAMPTF